MTIKITMHIAETVPQVCAAVTGLVLINCVQLQTLKLLPLYASGVRYRREPVGRESWLTIGELYARGFGDCEDLAAARCAELRHAGEKATIFVKLVNPTLMHIMVRRQDGALEDPSKMLGMGGKG